MIDQKIKYLLYESYDRHLSPAEYSRLKEALKIDVELQDLHQRLEKLNGRFAEHRIDSFGPWFAERVMNKIQSLPTKELVYESFLKNLLPMFRRVALISSVVFILILGFNISTSSKPNVAGAFGLDRMSIDELADPYNYLTLE